MNKVYLSFPLKKKKKTTIFCPFFIKDKIKSLSFILTKKKKIKRLHPKINKSMLHHKFLAISQQLIDFQVYQKRIAKFATQFQDNVSFKF